MKYEALTAGFTYHIYNRGNNSDIVFPDAGNYDYFLFLVKRHLLPISEIYAYCLMNNHFHFVLRIKDEANLPDNFKKRPFQAFSNMFNAYTRAINNFTGRTGSLFEKNFERKLISEDVYFRNLISYVHCNPVHHKVCSNFREYPYSSIHEYTSDTKPLISESFPLQLFDGLENFITFQEQFQKREMYVEMQQELE